MLIEKNKISVIVPVYNVEKYVSKCLASIIGQSYKNLEIIVVNDGSTGNSGVICDEYARSDNRVTVIHQKNSGVSSARNSGLEIATGELIGFVDGDDFIDTNMYEELVRQMMDENADIVCCAYKQIYPDKVVDFSDGSITSAVITNDKIDDFIFMNKYQNEMVERYLAKECYVKCLEIYYCILLEYFVNRIKIRMFKEKKNLKLL